MNISRDGSRDVVKSIAEARYLPLLSFIHSNNPFKKRIKSPFSLLLSSEVFSNNLLIRAIFRRDLQQFQPIFVLPKMTKITIGTSTIHEMNRGENKVPNNIVNIAQR